MAKVRVFQNMYTEALENDINEFLNSDEQPSVIDIKYSVAAIPLTDDRGIVDPMALFSALVYYNEIR